MAAPFVAPEDLEKLKKFIDFVASNPLILNVPQMGFLKRFIEKFGGKVPEGEFQMPAGGKCPFGGDAKTETKSCPHPPPPTQSDEDVVEESEESEVELDMEETDIQLLEPNVLYLDEKPPKIVKNQKLAKKRRGEISKKKMKTTKKSLATRATTGKSKHKLTIKKEMQSNSNKYAARNRNRYSSTVLGEDPLYTPEKDIKMEMDPDQKASCVDEFDCNLGKWEDPAEDIKYMGVGDSEEQQDKEYYSAADDEGAEVDHDIKSEQDYYFEDDYEDDEPLIRLARKKGRPRKYHTKYEDTNKMPGLAECRNICKQKCTQKFTEEQRNAMCDEFWSLAEEDKVAFIRKHTKTKRYKRLKRNKTKSRGNNYCYYLDELNKPNEENEEEQKQCGNELICKDGGTNLTRVCRKYFESTLCLTNYTIKKALDGYTPEVEMDNKYVGKNSLQTNDVDGKVGETKDTTETEAIEQYLDPETGDLITIDHKAEKSKCPANAETIRIATPKKKRVRPKPGDPLPEHNPKAIKCAERCIHKCHTKFTEGERKQICDVFWSMDYNRRKDFILARIETREVETERAPEFRKSNRPPRAYHTRFYLRSGKNGENIRVCKHFMMATLSITRNFITNAIEFADKNTGCYTGADRRGQNSTPRRISPDRMKFIKDQIASYPTWIPNKKSKTRYLHHKLSIKRMFSEYKEMCMAQQQKYVSTHIYYKTFHDDFRLSFLCNPEPKRGGGFLKANPNVSHYTGEEPGGIWLNPYGEKLDLSLYNPAQSFLNIKQTTSSPLPYTSMALAERPAANSSVNDDGCDTKMFAPTLVQPQITITTMPTSTTTTTSTISFNQPLNYVHIIEPPALSSNFLCQPVVAAHEFNVNIYDNSLPQAHEASSTSTSLFRRS
ncbi:uncharacterized protein LOC106096050 isoform X3 [Stomoxys calcitrans]|uniref:Hsp70-interacting protein N-terminal domain-containing protein n=1 Tax=Stomoxys calcitrans TaxID=35570 RepID=A0A1I8NR55_STOCA|nr:uncharacterized protein LOC106096050 isoform X3 [Stomoxys calcitrans]